MMFLLGGNEKAVARRARKTLVCDDQFSLSARDEIKFVFFVKRLIILSARREKTSVTFPFLSGSMSQTPSFHFSFAGKGSSASISSIVNFIFIN
jgi:hypothetical protein